MVDPRYAFRSPEKVALQEIGPRFTLKLRWVKRGLPAVQNFGAASQPLEISVGTGEAEEPDHGSPIEDVRDDDDTRLDASSTKNPPRDNDFLWQWKVCDLHPPYTSADTVSLVKARVGNNETDIFLVIYCLSVRRCIVGRLFKNIFVFCSSRPLRCACRVA